MKYKKSLLILITAIFLVSVAGVCASDANDTAIASDDSNQMELSSDSEISEDNLQTGEENSILTQNDDETVSAESDSQTLGAGEGTFSDLRNEIGNGGDKNLSKSYYRYNSGNAIQIKTPGVINGNGAIIDMAGATIRAFYVTVSNVTIKDLTIKNANCSAGGGAAIYFTSSGTVENCNFINNTAGDNGGAVNFAESGTVTNCNFTNNTAGNNAGALFQGNAYNCVFIGNRADGGGAMYEGFATNCKFIENHADGFGGVINGYNHKSINCTFISNSAGISGGALSGGEAHNCSFISNVASRDGGAINDANAHNCNFTGNKATSGSGGAIYFSAYGNVTNCNFTNNTAYSNGGAISIFSYSYGYSYGGDVENCNFINNIADNGGAIYTRSARATICNFVNNVARVSGGAMFDGVADTCIFKTGSDTVKNTLRLLPKWAVDNFITAYDSGEKLTFDLKTSSGMLVENGNISISVYYNDNGSWFGNYSCLSGE